MEATRTLLAWAAIALLLYAAACGLLFVFQRSLLYLPQPARHDVPAIRLAVDGAQLQVSVRAHPGRSAVLYFGGNAEDVSGSVAELAQAFPGRAIYALHYRGYGRSSGRPTESALHADAAALFAHVARSHDAITVVGRSLGSGLALRLATERPVERLVLVTPYDSITEVAAQALPIFPVRWLIRDRFDSASLAPRVGVPTTVIVAQHDEVIPRARTDALVGRFAPGVAQVVVVPDVGHNTLGGSRLYASALAGREP